MPDNESVDQATVGYFAADFDYLDGNPTRSRKTVKLTNIYSAGLELPEQGTWHLDRKKALLAAHPEARDLYGPNNWSFPLMLLVTATTVALAVYVRNWPWLPWLVCNYTLGALLSYQCQVMGHEGTHRLVFHSPLGNKIQTVIAFLPVFLGPFGMFWMVEHMWHHNVVVDKCLRYGRMDVNPVRKAVFTFLFINVVNLLLAVIAAILLATSAVTMVLYLVGLRTHAFPQTFPLPPYAKFPQTIGPGFVVNSALAAAFQWALYSHYGVWPTAFLFLAAGFMNGLHPLGMRQVQEHYFMHKTQPTYSVYTPAHLFALNINYHVEHHDFATIPWNRLPRLRQIAPEFYDPLHAYSSYTRVLFMFLFDNGIPIETVFEDSALDGVSFQSDYSSIFATREAARF